VALEHALLVSLSEQPAAGLELARRFDRSIGFFWSATHQQIYKVLRRMEDAGWVRSAAVGQQGRRGKTVYTVTPEGERALAAWIAATTPPEAFRSDLAVKLRGASYGDRTALLTDLEKRRADHATRLAHYEQLATRDFPEPDARMRILGPLDPVLWDRALVRIAFGFDYVWELFHPPAKRRFGWYVLPVLFRDRFVGRIEPRIERGDASVRILGLWWEEGFAAKGEEGFVDAMREALRAYLAFARASRLEWPPQLAAEKRLFARLA